MPPDQQTSPATQTLLDLSATPIPGRSRAVSAPQISSVPHQPYIDPPRAIAALKRWIQKRQGKTVEVVYSQTIADLDGNSTSINALVTTRLSGGVTIENLRQQLLEIEEAERASRLELQRARADGDVEAVNRVVAAIESNRKDLITANGLVSYKLSLARKLPPILAHWPGLPFETVREDAARRLATTKLGERVDLQGLVHYTSTISLLHFTDRSGRDVYVDPFRLVEVPGDVLRGLLESHRRHGGPSDRDARIAAQWAEFLN